jgi:hypothetical protein
VASIERTLLASLFLSACGLDIGGTPIAATELCSELARVVCESDETCFATGGVATECHEAQLADCQRSLEPLIEDPRLGYDPDRAADFVEELERQGSACWPSPIDPDLFFAVFAGTGASGADCTPPNLEPASLRISALSCANDNACRVHLRADGSIQGVCEARSGSACSHAHDCASGQFCSLPSSWQPGVWGECRPLRTEGWACASDLECASRNCDGTCEPRPAIEIPLRAPHADVVLASEPLAYLTGELGGTRLSDVSGNSRNGTVYGQATHMQLGAAPGDMSGALSLSGDGQYVVISALEELGEATALSFEVWFYVEDANRAQPILELFDGTSFGPHLWNFDRGDKIYANFVAVDSGGHSIMSDEGAVSMSAWHHAVATYDGTIGRLYLDGARIGETMLESELRVEGDLHIGHRGPVGDATAAYFAGAVDDVAVYDRALEEREIRAHYDAGVDGAIENRFPLFVWLAP